MNQACCIICCDDCWKSKLLNCSICSGMRKSFFGLNALNEFCKFLFEDLDKLILKLNGEKFKYTVRVIAHNSKSFDLHFIVGFLLKNRIKPKILKKGSKLICMNIGKFKFIDSLSFLPMALKKLPACFGLENDDKGYFPHNFNMISNWNYIGKFPAIEYYDIENLNETDKTKFLIWHKDQDNKIFNFKEQINIYCMNDCLVLMNSFIKFRKDWIDIYDLDFSTRCHYHRLLWRYIKAIIYLKNLLQLYHFLGMKIKETPLI